MGAAPQGLAGQAWNGVSSYRRRLGTSVPLWDTSSRTSIHLSSPQSCRFSQPEPLLSLTSLAWPSISRALWFSLKFCIRSSAVSTAPWQEEMRPLGKLPERVSGSHVETLTVNGPQFLIIPL